ncbi:MAG: hypothetical protein ACJ77D_10380 [Chloroflexota bacterium]
MTESKTMVGTGIATVVFGDADSEAAPGDGSPRLAIARTSGGALADAGGDALGACVTAGATGGEASADLAEPAGSRGTDTTAASMAIAPKGMATATSRLVPIGRSAMGVLP